MFVANKVDDKGLFDSWEFFLGKEKTEALKKSKGYLFYELIFKQIEESDFSVLYSDHVQSSPNRPINYLVSSLILIEQRKWSHSEFESQLKYNVEVRIALGLRDMEYVPYHIRTLYNFKNRLAAYEAKTGINLFEQLFKKLTKNQLRQYGLKTSIQRGDTVLLNSNIRSHSRLSLLVEVIKRLNEILSDTDRKRCALWLGPYLKGGEKYVYEVKSNEYASHLEQLGQSYYGLYMMLNEKYGLEKVFKMFERTYKEHFIMEEEEAITVIKVRPSKELSCDTLQSPDDEEATFKKKRENSYQGYSVLGVETCHPDNELNLVTNIKAGNNQMDDAKILAETLDEMMEETPDLEEAHFDGGFGSEAVDIKTEEHGITLVQTAIKGRVAQVNIKIEGNEEVGFSVSCPNDEQGIVKGEKTKKNYKAVFDLEKCKTCPFKAVCPTRKAQNETKGMAIFRFKPEDALRQKRHRAIQKIPKKRRTLRSGVENMMGLMHRGEKHTGKLKVRGLFNIKLYAFAMGISINFERIFRHITNISFFFCFIFNRKGCLRLLKRIEIGNSPHG